MGLSSCYHVTRCLISERDSGCPSMSSCLNPLDQTSMAYVQQYGSCTAAYGAGRSWASARRSLNGAVSTTQLPLHHLLIKNTSPRSAWSTVWAGSRPPLQPLYSSHAKPGNVLLNLLKPHTSPPSGVPVVSLCRNACGVVCARTEASERQAMRRVGWVRGSAGPFLAFTPLCFCPTWSSRVRGLRTQTCAIPN